MTANDFRLVALSFPESVESSHMDHPDFRVGGKVFATLGYFDKNWGMVKLMPDQQEKFVAAEPKVFVPAKGFWGERGATCVHLKSAKKTTVRKALREAWLNAAPKNLAKKFQEI
ncbi:MAG: MmcQ/YjbR family DNA-binding protein [Candidatus Acidoferrales bacterium]|nr:MmcQ/YjbR family DNA-binding protein [Candidatus Acidoferrales bacterium]